MWNFGYLWIDLVSVNFNLWLFIGKLMVNQIKHKNHTAYDNWIHYTVLSGTFICLIKKYICPFFVVSMENVRSTWIKKSFMKSHSTILHSNADVYLSSFTIDRTTNIIASHGEIIWRASTICIGFIRNFHEKPSIK